MYLFHMLWPLVPKIVVHFMWPIYGHMNQLIFFPEFFCFLCKMVKNYFFGSIQMASFFCTLWRPLRPSIGGSFITRLKCFNDKVYFKQPIGSWSQKCNPDFVQFGPLFIVRFRPHLFYRVQQSYKWFFGHNFEKIGTLISSTVQL